MALIPRSELLTPQSPSSRSQQVDPPIVVDTVSDFDKVAAIANVLTERTTFNTLDYPLHSKLLIGYLEGSRIKVEYYQNIQTGNLFRDNQIDTATARNNQHQPLRVIRNFELTIGDDALDFNSDIEQSEARITGEALVYPGIQPIINDLFLYEWHGGTIGVFKVTQTYPLTYHQERCYRIEFKFEKVLDEDYRLILKERSKRNITYFDKTLYLRNRNALLTESEYIVHRTLSRGKEKILKYYFNKFFDESAGTLLSPNGVFDPYLTKFMLTKSPFIATNRRPAQIYPFSMKHYQMSIWNRLCDLYDAKVYDLYKDYRVSLMMAPHNSVVINGLINKHYLQLLSYNEAEDIQDVFLRSPYVLSNAFYEGDKDRMSELEREVYSAINTKGVIDKEGFIDKYVAAYHGWPDEDQFYVIPMILGLIDIALAEYIVQPIQKGDE